jgi:hypothetical protein
MYQSRCVALVIISLFAIGLANGALTLDQNRVNTESDGRVFQGDLAQSFAGGNNVVHILPAVVGRHQTISVGQAAQSGRRAAATGSAAAR